MNSIQVAVQNGWETNGNEQIHIDEEEQEQIRQLKEKQLQTPCSFCGGKVCVDNEKYNICV